MKNLLRHLLTGLGSLGIVLTFASTGHAQAVYGVGQAGTGTLTIAGSTRLFSINTTTGAATNICGLSSPSTAVSVSSIDGQAYYIDRDGTGVPKLYRINPLTCANTFIGNITGAASGVLGDVTLRATHCPDGRFYAATNVGQFFEINANNAATLRTLNWTGLPTGGSGDFACVNNGDLYSVAPTTNGGGTYRLYRANAADFATVASGSNVPVTQIGANLGLTGTPNGIADGPTGAGCAASPAPCLYVSNNTNDLWRINTATGAATSVGPTNNGLTDLSRSFPVDLSFAKTVTPTTALQGQTVFYTLTASNPGPGVVGNILIQDAFPAGVAAASWACTVQTPGSATLVNTSCGATPTGTGNINTTVSLSLNATLRYNVTATLSNTFSGTLTNVGRATITIPVTDPDPGNNTGTATTTVTAGDQPAGHQDQRRHHAGGWPDHVVRRDHRQQRPRQCLRRHGSGSRGLGSELHDGHLHRADGRRRLSRRTGFERAQSAGSPRCGGPDLSIRLVDPAGHWLHRDRHRRALTALSVAHEKTRLGGFFHGPVRASFSVFQACSREVLGRCDIRNSIWSARMRRLRRMKSSHRLGT